MEKTIISSDADAVALLEKLLAEDVNPEVEFSGWPIFTLYLKGEKYEQSITPSLMRPLLELQKGLYKTATRAIYNDDNINRLTEEQREKFEYSLQVLPGSSDNNAKMDGIYTAIAKSAVGKMTGKQVTIVLLCAGLFYAGHSAYSKYLDHLDKVDGNAQVVKTVELFTKTIKDQQEAATKQAQVLADAVKQFPQVKRTQLEAEEVHFQVLRESRDADEVVVNGVGLTGKKAAELTEEGRQKSSEVKYVDQFRILAVDTTDALKTKVKVRKGKLELWASFNDDSLDSKAIRLLQKHLLNREPVRLRIEGKKLSDKILNARIIAVAPKVG